MEHARQVLIDGFDQDLVRSSKVAVVGCGGLGSNLAVALARLGVGEIVLMDFDRLEEHNLENQAFDQRDIGQYKTEALKTRVENIDPEIDAQIWTGQIQHYTGHFDADCVFGCFDNLAARYKLNSYTLRDGVPLIDAGIDRYNGTILVNIPGDTGCHYCYDLFPDAEPKPCDEDPIPTTYVTANVTASMQASQFVRLIHNEEVAGWTYLNVFKGVIDQSALEPDEDCALMCGEGSDG